MGTIISAFQVADPRVKAIEREKEELKARLAAAHAELRATRTRLDEEVRKEEGQRNQQRITILEGASTTFISTINLCNNELAKYNNELRNIHRVKSQMSVPGSGNQSPGGDEVQEWFRYVKHQGRALSDDEMHGLGTLIGGDDSSPYFTRSGVSMNNEVGNMNLVTLAWYQSMFNTVKQRLNEPDHRVHALVLGSAGVGKSMFRNFVARQLARDSVRENKPLVLLFDKGRTTPLPGIAVLIMPTGHGRATLDACTLTTTNAGAVASMMKRCPSCSFIQLTDLSNGTFQTTMVPITTVRRGIIFSSNNVQLDREVRELRKDIAVSIVYAPVNVLDDITAVVHASKDGAGTPRNRIEEAADTWGYTLRDVRAALGPSNFSKASLAASLDEACRAVIPVDRAFSTIVKIRDMRCWAKGHADRLFVIKPSPDEGIEPKVEWKSRHVCTTFARALWERDTAVLSAMEAQNFIPAGVRGQLVKELLLQQLQRVLSGSTGDAASGAGFKVTHTTPFVWLDNRETWTPQAIKGVGTELLITLRAVVDYFQSTEEWDALDTEGQLRMFMTEAKWNAIAKVTAKAKKQLFGYLQQSSDWGNGSVLHRPAAVKDGKKWNSAFVTVAAPTEPEQAQNQRQGTTEGSNSVKGQGHGRRRAGGQTSPVTTHASLVAPPASWAALACDATKWITDVTHRERPQHASTAERQPVKREYFRQLTVRKLTEAAARDCATIFSPVSVVHQSLDALAVLPQHRTVLLVQVTIAKQHGVKFPQLNHCAKLVRSAGLLPVLVFMVTPGQQLCGRQSVTNIPEGSEEDAKLVQPPCLPQFVMAPATKKRDEQRRWGRKRGNRHVSGDKARQGGFKRSRRSCKK